MTGWRERQVICHWRYQTRVKIYGTFHMGYYGFSQGWKSFHTTVVYMINKGYYMAAWGYEFLSSRAESISHE